MKASMEWSVNTAGPPDVGVSTMSSGSVALALHCAGFEPKTRSNSTVDVNTRVDMEELHTPSGDSYTQLHGAKSKSFLPG